MKNNETELWCNKYQPTHIDEVIGNKQNIQKIKEWLSNFNKGKKDTPIILFIYGPPGIGKTTIAHLVLKHYYYDTIEFNASDVRSQKSVKENITKILNNTNISTMKKNNNKNYVGIVMDEIDGMSGGEKGGINELINLIQPEKNKKPNYINPVICICNNSTDKKLSDIKKISLEIEFNKPTEFDLMKIAEKIVKKEKINIEEGALYLLVKYSQRDVRRLTFLLQDAFTYIDKEIITIEDIEELYKFFSRKNIDISLLEISNKIINYSPKIDEILDIYQNDKSLIGMILHENYISTIQKNRKEIELNKLKYLYEISHYFSIGDIIDKYIYNFQYWNLQPYNGIIKCALPSRLLDKMKKTDILNNKLNFTNILSKSALQLGNHKNITQYKYKFNISKKYIFYASQILLNGIVNNSKNKQELDKYILLAKNYNLTFDDIDKLIKIEKLDKNNNIRKHFTSKNKNKYKELFTNK